MIKEIKQLQQLARKYPDTVAKMAIRGPAVELYKWVIKKDSVTSRMAANYLGVSIQSASARLDKLYRRGYLMRTEIEQDSGGFEYLYKKID